MVLDRLAGGLNSGVEMSGGNIFENAISGVGDAFSGGLDKLNVSPVWQNLTKAATLAILGYAGAGALGYGGLASGAGGAGGAGAAGAAGAGEGAAAGGAAGTGEAAGAGWMGDATAAGYDPYYANASGVGIPSSMGGAAGGTNWWNLASKGMKLGNMLNQQQAQQYSQGSPSSNGINDWVNSQSEGNRRLMLAQNLMNKQRMESPQGQNTGNQYG